MQSDDEIIAVVQAHKEGKKIEASSRPDEIWHFCEHPAWAFSEFDYRLAPEPPKPREWIMAVVTDGKTTENVLVREVIGASSGNPTVAADTASCKPRTLDDIPDKIYCP